MNETPDPLPRTGAAPAAALAPTLRDIATDAIRYWEPRRIPYNTVLAMVVVAYFIAGWPGSRKALTLDAVFLLFVLAALANLCYCAAYIPDIFLQLSGFRAVWRRWRWLLLLLGVTLATILTHFFVLGMFYPAPVVD